MNMECSLKVMNEKVSKLEMKIDLLIDLFESLKHEEASNDPISLEEAAEFLNLKKSTIYQMTSKKSIPFSKKGKHLYFFKSDLLDWLSRSKRIPYNQLQMPIIDRSIINPSGKRKANRK